jgi:hypothetical protein
VRSISLSLKLHRFEFGAAISATVAAAVWAWSVSLRSDPSGSRLRALRSERLGRAVELFRAAKAAEGASPRTIELYQMITVRLLAARW